MARVGSSRVPYKVLPGTTLAGFYKPVFFPDAIGSNVMGAGSPICLINPQGNAELRFNRLTAQGLLIRNAVSEALHDMGCHDGVYSAESEGQKLDDNLELQ